MLRHDAESRRDGRSREALSCSTFRRVRQPVTLPQALSALGRRRAKRAQTRKAHAQRDQRVALDLRPHGSSRSQDPAAGHGSHRRCDGRRDGEHRPVAGERPERRRPNDLGRNVARCSGRLHGQDHATASKPAATERSCNKIRHRTRPRRGVRRSTLWSPFRARFPTSRNDARRGHKRRSTPSVTSPATSLRQEGPPGKVARTEPDANAQLDVGESVSLYVNGAPPRGSARVSASIRDCGRPATGHRRKPRPRTA